ncbi:MAG: hypothetical protein IRY85_12830 [Micromonosporaceae bacterium]|nr:hypothetical protein [Micromonosporaceae bacterium]
MTTASEAPRITPGESAKITQRQDEPQHLQRLLAYTYHYRLALRWRRARAAGTFVVAAIGPILALFVPAVAGLVAATAAGWLVLGRTIFTWLEQRNTLQAVKIQELYDTDLFHLPWNDSLAGRRPSPEDVAAAARQIRDDKPYRNWYSIDLGDTPWPADVLLCQRQSTVWSRRDHHAYGITVFIVGLLWLVVGLIIALTCDLSLADYLVRVFLPSAPVLLDAVELGRAHWRHAAARQRIEHTINELWDQYVSKPESLTVAECRAIQDATYILRRDGPRVPGFFYAIRKSSSQATTRAGAESLRAQLPSSASTPPSRPAIDE